MKPILLSLYEKSMPNELTWQQRLQSAAQAGFDAVEMSVDETPLRLERLDMSRQARVELLEVMRNEGVYLSSICLSGHRKYPFGSSDPAIESHSRAIMEKAIELAYDLGIRIIQLAGYDVYYDEQSSHKTRDRFINNLRWATRLAASRGVILALETMENDFLNTVAKGMEYVRLIDSPYLQMYPDVGNLTNAQQDVEADIKAGRGHIAAAHLKETLPGIFRDLKYGEGHVDFQLVCDTLISQDVRFFTAEFWYDGKDNWRDVLQASHDFIRPYLAI